MKSLGRLALVAVLVGAAIPAMAVPIVILAPTSFTASDTVGIPLGTTFAPGAHGGGGIMGGPIAFVLPTAGILHISIVDCCLVGDVYEAVVSGVSVGLTSFAAIGGPTLSTGDFFLAMPAGAATLDIWDITLSYIGFASPFGGGVVPTIYSPAGLTVSIDLEPIPEPSTVVLLVAGLAGLAVARRRSAA